MRRWRFQALPVLAFAAAATAATVAGGAGAGQQAVSGKLSVVGIWTATEQKSFQAVIGGFNKQFPDVKVSYTSGGNNTPTILQTAITGGKPPDIAAIGQPALVRQFAKQGHLKPISFAQATIAKNLGPSGVALGSVNGKLYGLFFKAANKSTVWYNVHSFKNAGVKPPATWPQLLTAAKTLRSSGTPAFAIGGSEGWTLTDLFENIYLRTAGPAKYDQLTDHKIKWTDPSVKTALKFMGQILGDTGNIPGGASGALQTGFPQSVNEVFSASPKAAMIMEGDFVPGVASSIASLKPFKDYNMFPFPSINGSPPSVVAGGDTVVMFKDSPATRAFISYLAGPEASTIWAKRGGFTSPNKAVPLSAYSDALTRASAKALVSAKASRFDLSDLEPPAFGATTGQGEWKIFQDFLKNPKNINGTASALEAAAAKAFK
jgi:alpha-glucoside transport system substrate-binding protein